MMFDLSCIKPHISSIKYAWIWINVNDEKITKKSHNFLTWYEFEWRPREQHRLFIYITIPACNANDKRYESLDYSSGWKKRSSRFKYGYIAIEIYISCMFTIIPSCNWNGDMVDTISLFPFFSITFP